MSNNTIAAQAYLRVANIRERERKMALARLQSDMANRQDRLDQAHSQQQADMAVARNEVTGSTSAADLLMLSDALLAGQRRVQAAQAQLEELDAPMETARGALTMSARERLVAEKWLERKKERALAERRQKIDRQQDDLTAARNR